MGKLIISLIVVLGLVAIGGLYLANQSNDYELTVDTELDALEAELASIEAEVAAGTMTPEQAADARARIFTRLDAVETSMTAAADAELSTSQKMQLQQGLDRLKNTLLTFQATLTAVDETAASSESVRRSSGGRTLTAAFVSTIEASQEAVIEVSDEDYEPNDNVDDLIDDIADEAPDNLDDIEVDMNATSTATSSDEEMNDSEDDESSDDSDAEGEATTTVEVEVN